MTTKTQDNADLHYTVNLMFDTKEPSAYKRRFKRANFASIDDFLNKRDEVRGNLFSALFERMVPFTVTCNNGDELTISVTVNGNDDSDIIPCLLGILFPEGGSETTGKLPVSSTVYRYASKDQLLDYIIGIAVSQSNRYVYVFELPEAPDHAADKYLSFILFTDKPLRIDVTKPVFESVISELYVKSAEDLPISITTITHVKNGTMIDVSSEIIGYISSLQEYQKTLEPKPIEQGDNKSDNPNLTDDLIVKEDVLYSFDVDNAHAEQVLKQSILHHRLPYIVFNAVSESKVYCIISANVLNYIRSNARWLTSRGYIVSELFTSNLSGTKYVGFGIIEDKTKYPSTREVLSIMRNGLI